MRVRETHIPWDPVTTSLGIRSKERTHWIHNLSKNDTDGQTDRAVGRSRALSSVPFHLRLAPVLRAAGDSRRHSHPTSRQARRVQELAQGQAGRAQRPPNLYQDRARASPPGSFSAAACPERRRALTSILGLHPTPPKGCDNGNFPWGQNQCLPRRHCAFQGQRLPRRHTQLETL